LLLPVGPIPPAPAADAEQNLERSAEGHRGAIHALDRRGDRDAQAAGGDQRHVKVRRIDPLHDRSQQILRAAEALLDVRVVGVGELQRPHLRWRKPGLAGFGPHGLKGVAAGSLAQQLRDR